MEFPPSPFIPAWSLSKSLPCLLLQPGLKPGLVMLGTNSIKIGPLEPDLALQVSKWPYSFLFNTSHGNLIREIGNFPQILLFQPGL